MELATKQASEPIESSSSGVRPEVLDPNWSAYLRRIAHELLSPMTTLRLTLQIGRGRLMRGDAVELATLERALAQVDELSARVNRLCVSDRPLLSEFVPPARVEAARVEGGDSQEPPLPPVRSLT